jgi:VIT1/CCC1 family predicted Fe2+/Mn2+ transporter
MCADKNEIERLKRLRDRQIQLRDPQKAQQKLQSRIATKRRKSTRAFSIKEIMTEIPHKWWGILLGAALGVAVLIVLPYFMDSIWADLIGIGAILFLTILGYFIGQAMDVRDSLKDLMK